MPEPTDAASEEQRARLRAGLLGQLAHLIREVEMLEGVIGRVPERLLAEAPPEERFSIKETFGLLALLDEAVHRARLARIAAEDAPRFDPFDPEALLAEEAWGERAMDAIFARVQEARRGLIDAFEAVPPPGWRRAGHFPGEPAGPEETSEPEPRDLYEMAHAIGLHDTAHLRALSRRLFESHLGPAPE